jgi:hypothetical protein
MATMVKCTRVGGEIIHINFDQVYLLESIAATAGKPAHTCVSLSVPGSREGSLRYEDVIDPAETLARSANSLK